LTADEITYRRARTEDAERTFEVVQEAADDLNRKAGRPVGMALPAARVIRFRHFAVRYDPDRFWVAEAGGRMVGSGFASLRDDVWYLGGLHVLPDYQSRKIGSELIRRCLSGTRQSTTLTVLTDALNPVSNGLYLRFGMLPQDSTLTYDGPLGEGEGTGGRADAHRVFTSRPIDLERDQPTLAALDLGSVAFARPVDHEFWTGVPGLTGVILEAGGSARGYAYVSDAGAIGPVAVTTPEDLRPALDLCADTAAASGAASLHLRVNGVAREASAWAVDRGLRLTGIGLMLSSRPVGRLDRYVTSGADALY
jgi:GNAT superfamily N-acetyltransferase